MAGKILIIGAGLTGITLAEKFASRGNQVLIIDNRNHIGGNCYDLKNREGILIHKYGPHIFHTSDKEVFDYLAKFTEWIPYEHKVLGYIDGKFAPVPFNLNSLYVFFPEEQAKNLEDKLIKEYGFDKRVTILELKKVKDKELNFLADFIYQKIYLNYNQKQWGKKPEEIDPSVTARVPILINRDDRYFQDKYQAMPKHGYTKMFEKMLKSKNIEIKLKSDYNNIKGKTKYDSVFFTGPVDYFFDYKFGKLEYRYLRMKFKTLNRADYQPCSVVNYPGLEYPFTRITEFKKLTQQKHKKTSIGIEFPGKEGFMSWPVLDRANQDILKSYQQEVEKLKEQNIYFVGRLAEFKYYDMDDAVKNALEVFNKHYEKDI